MSSPPTSAPKGAALRPSKFIEGDPLTRPEMIQRTNTSNELLCNILSEMDAFEQKRKHRDSNSSVESLTGGIPSPIVGRQELRRSFGTGRPSLDERGGANGHGERSHSPGKLSQKFKGRLRAFTTGGRDKEEEGKTAANHGHERSSLD